MSGKVQRLARQKARAEYKKRITAEQVTWAHQQRLFLNKLPLKQRLVLAWRLLRGRM